MIFGIAGSMLAENPPIPYRICLVIYRLNNKFLNGLIYTVAACAWLITIHKLQIGPLENALLP